MSMNNLDQVFDVARKVIGANCPQARYISVTDLSGPVSPTKKYAIYVGIFSPSYLSMWANQIQSMIPDTKVYVGTSGVVDGRIIIEF